MPITTSLIVVALIAAWLFVLVPMVARRREHVPDAEEGGHHFRVLRRASASLRRRPKFGQRDLDTDLEYDESEVDQAENSDDDLEEVLLDNEHDIESAELDDLEEEQFEVAEVDEYEAVGRGGRVAVAEMKQSRSLRRQAIVAEPETAEVDYEADGEYEDDYQPEALDDDHQDDPRYRPVPRRRGRGGYDPEAAEAARAYRYSRRRKVALVLLVATLVFSAAAYFISSLLWAGAGFFGVLLVAYLGYLRRQVRIEEDIRQRRMARLRRARQIRPEYGRSHDVDYSDSPDYSAQEVPDRPAVTVPPSAHLGRGRRRVVEFDDDDPVFDELEYYEPVTYRRAAGQ